MYSITFNAFLKGTGKTSTLVAAIEEIVRSTNKAVLVCANSNSACDEITERLVKVLHFGEMFRMYARSFDKRQISENIMPICNWIKGKFHLPSLEVLYKFRVVVCTLSTTGCIVRAARNPRFGYRKNPYFGCHHFSHIFVDECASTHETVSMIPITGKHFNLIFRKLYSRIAHTSIFTLIILFIPIFYLIFSLNLFLFR